MAPGVKISELKHRVAICTMKDVVLSADRMVLRRGAVGMDEAGSDTSSIFLRSCLLVGYSVQDQFQLAQRIVFEFGVD